MNAVGPQLPPRTGRRGWVDRGLTFAALAAMVWFFAWTIQSGGGFGSGGGDDLYIQLVRGYLKGHLHLDHAPSAELMALADPYDPARNGPYRIPDASYYRGHYYLYFGVVPAVVLMLPYALLTGEELPTGPAIFVFCVVGYLAASGLWLALRRRYFPASAVWTGALGVLVLGMSTHVLALARRPMVWELPIAAGFAFAMLALVAINAAVHGRRPLMALGLAGLSLGLAMASRPPNLFGSLMLLPPVWLLTRRQQSGGRAWWKWFLAAGAGLAVCGLAILAHNHARFDHPLEFGQNYQLTSSRELSNRHFGLDYIAHNFKVYYLLPLKWSWEFPFVAAHTPSWNNPDYAGGEEMCGLGATFPFLWLALAAPLAWRRRPAGERRALRAMLVAIAGLFVGVGIFLLSFFSTTERYMAEFSPALALLAVCGWLGVERWAQRAPARNWLLLPLPALAALATVPMGFLVSLNYHGNLFSRDNPALWSRMERACGDALGRFGLWTDLLEGPAVLKVRFSPRPSGTVETLWRATDAHADERVVVEYVSDRELRFGFARGAAPVRWGNPVTWEPGRGHTIELQLPSLYRTQPVARFGVRRMDEFRERSSIAVKFSGTQVLHGVVEPLYREIVPGGTIGADFSGKVRRVSKRLFDPEDVVRTNGPERPPGGTLRLRVIFPDRLAPEGEPLFAAGVLYGSDLVAVRDAGDGAVTLSFEHFGAPPVVSPPLRLAPMHEHTIEISLPSCRAGEAFSAAASGEVILKVNGGEVLRAHQNCHGFAAGSESIGRNPFGLASTKIFRGWLLEAQWTGN